MTPGDPKLDALQTSTARRYRYFIDIVVLIAAVFGLEIAAQAIYTPKTMEGGYGLALIIQMLEIVIACALIWFRPERLADIGLKRPRSWLRAIGIGVVLAAIFFAAIYFSEKAGFHRELSRFSALQGNLHLTLITLFYVLIGAGFYEEFMFRGFLMQSLAMFFGGSRAAWWVALIIQALLFGASHAYQNPLGMLITGTLGFLLGLLVILSGRNLWAAIIAHGLFDASRSILFYFQGPPHG
ncbi:MAG TPA: type II CAAX endopeptidase family protein [Chthoniobacterales bacterium]|jgi:membrane protease YdiL (CAAX protease family)|nr:type II CAAX endopeptidase family protein [Chthoniobacterales bacterium]